MFSTSQLPKVVPTWCALYILTSTCASRNNAMHYVDAWIFTSKFTSKSASRHNPVYFFDISTSRSGPKLVCFVHFDFQTRFAPQRRAFFGHLEFDYKNGPKPLFFHTFTSTCDSSHNRVHFFDISTSKTGSKMSEAGVLCAF